MALEPEIQRIMLRDGPAVLGDPSQWPTANACITSMAKSLTLLQREVSSKSIRKLWRAWSAAHPRSRLCGSPIPMTRKRLEKGRAGFKALLEGLLVKPVETNRP